jgi:adenylate cyclase
LESGEDVLAGATQEATVLFSDIRRFTTISEQLGTRETVAMLNEYFTAMVEVIFRNDGLLDKYIGDAIMAVFGAPVINPYDAENALRVGNEMMRELRSFNERRAKEGHEPIAIGVGISTGEVLAGSIGSLKRMEYTVIGNTVNLAARLESATKHYGASLLLGERTVERLSAPRDLREIDLIRAKGLVRPITIYESTAHYPDDVRNRLSKLAASYGEGIAAYRAQRWDQAIGCFEAALKRRPDDGPSRVYRDRCCYFRDHPPGEDWDGVWTMTEK